MKVCEKVESKGKTTYNEVADELVAEFSAASLAASSRAKQPGMLFSRHPQSIVLIVLHGQQHDHTWYSLCFPAFRLIFNFMLSKMFHAVQDICRISAGRRSEMSSANMHYKPDMRRSMVSAAGTLGHPYVS